MTSGDERTFQCNILSIPANHTTEETMNYQEPLTECTDLGVEGNDLGDHDAEQIIEKVYVRFDNYGSIHPIYEVVLITMC